MADSSTSSTSSISQGAFKTTKPSHFRAKIKVQNIEIVVRKLHQNTIKLSVKNLKKKQSNNTQLSEKMAARNQTKDLKCATHLLNDKFRNMTEEKKAIVRDLGFGGLMHIPPLRVDHQLLRELANNFKLGENRLKTGYGDLFPEKVDYKKLSDDDKIIYRRFQDYQEKKKKAINGCLFALMIIYFHLSKNKGKNRTERPPKPWIANWTKEQLVERMTAEREEILGIVKMAETRERMKKKKEKKEKKQEIKKTKKRKASPTSSLETETTDSDTSTSESEAQEDSEDSGRKHPSKKGKKMDSRKRKQRQEESDSDSESESEPSDESEESSPAEKEKKKKKTKTTPKNERYEISSDELDEWLRENVDKSVAEGENQADLRSTEGRYVSSET
ncbi:hypothetical protein Ahy_A01g001520 [Arachis hypogaea]|uniref:Uncharacterized protein n=1 Tax=Arachis hypogaea TaxID=3818 RepID=A0A445ENL1_ARAHY|nr:hypothetical protein Ahy_A01g001520 [Arachis hypogaea]